MNKTEQHIDPILIPILEQVSDPEIPVLSIMDMGVVRSALSINGIVEVEITPTYSGCPAMDVIGDDIEKALFKYEATLCDLSLKDRGKISETLSKNIKTYKKHRYYYKKDESDLEVKRTNIDDIVRVKLAYDLIFSMKRRDSRNEYLSKFIDIFTRSSDKEYEDSDYLYNKYTDEKILCKHYLYECNISNDNICIHV